MRRGLTRAAAAAVEVCGTVSRYRNRPPLGSCCHTPVPKIRRAVKGVRRSRQDTKAYVRTRQSKAGRRSEAKRAPNYRIGATYHERYLPTRGCWTMLGCLCDASKINHLPVASKEPPMTN